MLQDLLVRLAAVLTAPPDQLAVWRVLVAHPWVQAELTYVATRVVRARGLPRDSVPDVVQEAVIRLARRRLRPNLARPGEETGGYLRHACRWAVLDAARRCVAPGLTCLQQAKEPTAAGVGCPDVWELIARLPARQRRVIELRLESFTFEEIGPQVGLSLSGGYGEFRKARRTLQAALAG